MAAGDEAKDAAEYQRLLQAGLEPTSLNIRREQGTFQKTIFPGAILYYGDKQIPVNFLGTHFQTGPAAESIHNAVQNLEYQFSYAIRQLLDKQREKIGFVTGHGESGGRRMIDITGTLNQVYEVRQADLKKDSLDSLATYTTLILAKPIEAFSETEKYKLDQYLMQGGKLLIFADRFNASLDSMRARGSMLALPLELNLDDLFFGYGFRINYDLIRDMNCTPIPVILQTGQQGNQQLMPWVYFPLILPRATHPIVRNIDPIHLKFTSSIDTIATPGIRKTILLKSSPYTQKANAPVYLSLEAIQEAADPRYFKAGELQVALLLEGSCHSALRNG